MLNVLLKIISNYLNLKIYGVEIDSLSQVATETGISEKNLNRFLNYDGLEGYKKLFK